MVNALVQRAMSEMNPRAFLLKTPDVSNPKCLQGNRLDCGNLSGAEGEVERGRQKEETSDEAIRRPFACKMESGEWRAAMCTRDGPTSVALV